MWCYGKSGLTHGRLKVALAMTATMGFFSLPACSQRDSAGSTKAAAAQGAATAPLPRLSLQVTLPAANGHCPAVSIKVEPLGVTAAAPGNEYGGVSFTDIQLKQPDGETQAACEGAALSAALAPGRWQLSVPLPSGPKSCERSVGAAAAAAVHFVDGKLGCG